MGKGESKIGCLQTMQEKWDLWKRRGHLLLECDDKRAGDITDSLFRNDNERRMLIAEAWRTGNYGMLNETGK